MAIEAAAGLTGGCQCGAVRYRLEAEPTGVNVCHCRMCQKASGGPFMTFGGVRMAEFVVTQWRDIDLSQFGHRRARLLRAMRDPSDLSRPRRRPHQRDAGQSRRSERSRADGATRRRIEACAGLRARWRSGDADRAMAGAEEDRRRAKSPAPGSRSLNAARGSRGKENTNERRLHL